MSFKHAFFVLMLLASTMLFVACTNNAHPTDATAAPTVAFAPVIETPVSSNKPPVKFLPPEEPPSDATAQFKTDFTKHTVSYTEIFSGGPPKDGIPALDHPQFVSVPEADAWLKSNEPVILVEQNGDARAYPLQILIWHEIANDTVGGIPLLVTFCPLCNTAIAFERTVKGRVLDFGTTGRLRYSNLVMYDRQTESWWQQASGEAIAGEFTGAQLNFLPASIISWNDFKTGYPNGKVLSRETGSSRSYGQNPYAGYDDVNSFPFLYRGPETPGKLKPIARVLTVDLNGETVAYPYDVLQKLHVVNDEVGGKSIVVFWQAGTASALDAGTIAGGRDVGAGVAYSSKVDGETLTFKVEGTRIVDEQTNSEWDLLGNGASGKLQGKQLMPIVAINHFWFSWAAFKPETRVYQP